MADTGEVPRDVVLLVLRAHEVDISPQQGNDNPEMCVLAKGGIVESREIPPMVGRRVLQHFKHKFEIPIHHFYNPLMVPTPSDEKPQ